ncbi:hypothetical protein DUI87_18071 [Hirundo rustica rustica]|uniref:CCHC-type domain-containing protein n=1 Tax=Hirundo rustica rustica TaxID=333673 RepID=A0A3M0JV68_HIRRU|nr:hypothetical protein DUI87_18071 [Hirundo rustica rustica]
MTSSAVQTTPPPGRRDSSTSGSHAPPPGSHGLGPEGAGPEPESSQSHRPSPIPSLAPVVYKHSRGGHQVRPVYHPFPQSAIKDLCKAHKDYGRESPYFRGLLRSDLNVAAVTPADLRQLFSCLMNSTEFQLWESAWRRLLSDALPSLLVDPETTVDEEGNALTLDHLMGEGRWTAPVDQANIIPPKALDIVRDHAMTAFFGMAPDGPKTSYFKIFQEQEESFTAFVERLTRAVELQIPDVSARRGILREMAFNNANSLCRTAILSLPLDPPPTLAEMLRVCQIEVPLLQTGETSQQKKTPKVATATTQPPSGPTPQRRPYVPNRQRCYLCGDVGHWATQCHLKKDFDNFKNKKGGGGGEGQAGQTDNQKN